MESVYELHSVSKFYDNVRALDVISLSIGTGEITGVIGRSGAGKTTLLKILAGLELPTAGKLLFKGDEIDRKSVRQLRRVATILFQTPLFLRGDVYTNVAYGLRIRNHSRESIGKMVVEALSLVRLDGFEDRDARRLSGGEQQRVALARALVLDPRVLLLDEPTSNLDRANASVMTEIIEEEGEKRCVVIATHDYEQIKKLADRTIFLEAGRIVEVGATDSIFSGPLLANMENVYTGVSRLVDGISHVDIGNGVEIKAAFSRPGRVVVHVSPEDIILSKGWVETSARNEFKGRITAVEDLGPIARLKIDTGKSFTVQITKRSLIDMGLNVDSEVYLSFKASSVELV